MTYESDPGDEQPEVAVTVKEPSAYLRDWHFRPGTLVSVGGRKYEVVRWRSESIVELRR